MTPARSPSATRSAGSISFFHDLPRCELTVVGLGDRFLQLIPFLCAEEIGVDVPRFDNE